MQRISLGLLLYFTVVFGYPQSPGNQPTTICWDASLSMIDRNFSKESDFLQAYFKIKQNTEVTLLVFGNTIRERGTFTVKSGDWSALKQKLADITYDGATSYDALADYSNEGDILLFTDGAQNTHIASPNFAGDLYIVNSKNGYNTANVNLLMILSGGEFINLAGSKYETVPPANNYALYSGRVSSENAGVGEVSIHIKGAGGNAIKANKEGTYRIKATPGDTLIFSVPGRKSAEKYLGENRNINVVLKESGEIRLDEVVLTEKIGVPGEAFTAYGPKDKNAVGYAVQSMTEKDISDISTEVSQATQGKFSGVTLGQSDRLSQVEIRSKWSVLSNNYGLVVIDGVPMAKANSSVFSSGNSVQKAGFIDPKNIASITVLKSLAATNRYRSLGSNGAILITTKTASFGTTKEKKDLTLLTDNVYDGKIIVSNKTLVTPYLKELKKGKNVEEAYGIYLNQREQYWDDPAYFVDVFDFFKGSAEAVAYRIITNIIERELSSLIALKGMLFKMEMEENFELALETADAILKRNPDKIQSYLDLALAHKNVQNVQVAVNMLSAISDGTINPELDFSGLKKTVDREIRNIIHHHKNTLDLSKVVRKFLTNLNYDARVVVDWTSPNVQFELQFVNPKKRFFTWEHTAASGGSRLKNELLNGYTKEEFEIFGPETKGEWMINVKYLGNTVADDSTPAFLKCIVNYHFGTPEQRTEQHLVRLYEKGSEEVLAKLNIK